jgi:undecaprenyl-diphosphatase
MRVLLELHPVVIVLRLNVTLWEAALLGVIQGLTEFLPVSSTAHLLVARNLLGHTNPKDSFTTIVQMGTLVAVFLYFRHDIWKILKAVIGDVRLNQIGSTVESRLAWLIIIGTIPVGLIGFLFQKQIKNKFYNTTSMAVVAILFALLMLAAEIWYKRRKERQLVEDDLGWPEAIWMGLWQMLALMPGASRSGTTISGGLFAGLNRATAARFSFLLSLPSIFAAGLKDLYDEYKQGGEYKAAKFWLESFRDTASESAIAENQAKFDIGPGLFGSSDQMAALAVGILVSGVVGYISIAFLLAFLRKYSMNLFVVYRIVFGITLIALVLQGILK